jgi:tRNA 2-selenouridine synthase
LKILLQADDFVENIDKCFTVDVRSPGEFKEASIPGAVNIPLFTDEERAIVGTTYWKEGTDRAKLVGLTLVSQKLPAMVGAILDGAQGREIVLYCWRGGLRSRSVAAVLEVLGYPVRMLVGGYKSFRRQVVGFLGSASLDVPVFVLNGLTGVGKTLVVKELQSRGAPALDLESMANHRGSVFGSVGLGCANSQKDFEALLFLGMKKHSKAPYLIVEGEGKRIGPVVIPDFFFEAMRQSPHILLDTALEVRVERITDEYRGNMRENAEALAQAVLSLEKRLGRQKCEQLAAEIRSGHYEEPVRLLCTDYYDCFYRDSRQEKGDYVGVVDVTDVKAGAGMVLEIIDTYLAGKGKSHDAVYRTGGNL